MLKWRNCQNLASGRNVKDTLQLHNQHHFYLKVVLIFVCVLQCYVIWLRITLVRDQPVPHPQVSLDYYIQVLHKTCKKEKLEKILGVLFWRPHH